MMMVPMVPSQSLHNGYVKYGRLLRSSGLSSGSVISRPENFFPAGDTWCSSRRFRSAEITFRHWCGGTDAVSLSS